MADMDSLALGSWSEARRTYRKLVSAGLLTRLFYAKLVHKDFMAQVDNCSLTASQGADRAPDDIRQLMARHTLEITRFTGMTPREQYTKLTLREFAGLVKHCSWVEHREDKYHAAMAGGKALADYPRHDVASSADKPQVDEQDRLKDVMSAWTGYSEEVH